MARKPKTQPQGGEVTEEAKTSDVTPMADEATEEGTKRVKHDAGPLTFYSIDN